MSLYAVIMAGGRGERFWPMGRRKAPKQLLSLGSDNTMLEDTVLRLFPLIPAENIIVITNVDFVDRVRELLPIPAENVIGEPVGRNTAPCVALATAWVKRVAKSDDATMILLPADHVIRPAKALHNVLLKAAKQAKSGALVTIGITPTYSATGYGYIHCGQELSPSCYVAKEFREKPDKLTAEQFFANGNYKWNSGMFIWSVGAIYREFIKSYAPLADFIDKLESADDFDTALNEEFPKCEKISIDYAIMEKAENVVVCESSFYWNDIGSWSSLRSLFPQDRDGNVCRGRTMTLDTTNSVIMGDEEYMLGVIGMRDVAVVKSGNGILICPLSEEQRVKELTAELAKDPQYSDFI